MDFHCFAYVRGPRHHGPSLKNDGREGESNAAVHKAAGKGEPVTQDIAISVKGNRVECMINGSVVAGYETSALVTAGKLKSLDGVIWTTGFGRAHTIPKLLSPGSQ